MDESYENQNSQLPWDSEPGFRYIPPKKEKSGWSGGKVVALALVCSLLGGAFGHDGPTSPSL